MELTSGTMAEVTTELDWMRKVTKNPETMRMRSAKKVGVLEICLNKQADRNSPSTTAFSPRTMMAKDTMNIAREEKRMITPMVSSARSLSAKRYLQQSVTFVRFSTRMNIRIYSYQKIYTNECPNIFV